MKRDVPVCDHRYAPDHNRLTRRRSWLSLKVTCAERRRNYQFVAIAREIWGWAMQVDVYEKMFLFARNITDSAAILRELAKQIPDEQDALHVAEVHLMELRADVFYQILWFVEEQETDESALLHQERVALQRKFFDPDGTYVNEIDSLIPGRLPHRRRERHPHKTQGKKDEDPST